MEPPRGYQFLHVAKATATETLATQIAEEASHNVEPGTTGGREVHVEAANKTHANAVGVRSRLLDGGAASTAGRDLPESRAKVVWAAQQGVSSAMKKPIIT
jgi:hypothetical protein